MIRKTNDTSATMKDAAALRKAVGRWENEGGAGTGGPEAISRLVPGAAPEDLQVKLKNAELIQLQTASHCIGKPRHGVASHRCAGYGRSRARDRGGHFAKT